MLKLSLHSFLLTAVILLCSGISINAQPRHWGMDFKLKDNFTIGKQFIDQIDVNNSDPKYVTGFGLDWYTSPKTSINFLASLGLDSESQENTSEKVENSSTEIGAKFSYLFYPIGMDKSIYWYVGPWASYTLYSEDQTITPTSGTESKNEYSTSSIGIGATAGVYWKPWEDFNLEIGAGYNLGAQISPSSTITTNGESIDGPSSTHIGDCGGNLTLRYFFNHELPR